MKKGIFLIVLFFASILFAQEKPEKDLKVGLVLSGGGAKGLAHVSVLKVLEEAGVRVDYIGGTSMGAIVGALYASGYNAKELDSIIHAIDFFKVISNNLPRKSKPFYEKEMGEKYALTLPIKNRKVGIPVAITDGQNVLNLLTRLTQHVNNINNFDKLPIPFLCIATDLETGNQKVFREGFLPEVVKASGSFPTLLSPVEIDGKLYSDGGIVNNFPVDEVKAMGADIIIGVDIQGGLETKDKLNSAPKILNQIVGFQMYKTVDEKRAKTDILIRPNLEKFSVVSFEADAINKIMKIGDTAARKLTEQLKAIGKLQIKKQKKTVEFNKSQKFHIKRIEIQGNKNYTRAYVLGKLNLKNRDTTSYKSLLKSIDNLYGTGNFQSIQYKIVNENNGSVVKFKVKEHVVANYFQIGVHYDNLYKTGILINGVSKHLFFKNDVISNDIILGDNIRYNLNYFVDNGFYTSFGLKSRYNSFNSNIRFDENNMNKINLEYEDFTNQVYVQTVFNRKFAIGAGVEHKRIKAYTETTSTVENNALASKNGRFYFDKSDYISGIGYIKIDTYDKKYFQKKGVYFDTRFTWYWGSTDYNKGFSPFSQLKGKLGYAYTFSNNLTAHFTSEAGITIGTNSNQALDFIVGGYGDNYINNFIPMFGYDFGELREDSFLKSALTLRYEFLPKNYVSASVNYARVENDIFNEGDIFDNTKSGYMIGYGLDTFLGPIEVNYAWSPDQKSNNWYFNVGYWF